MSNKTHISQIDDRTLFEADGSSVLSAGGVLIGPIIQVAGYTHVTGFVYSDVDSAVDGFIVEQALAEADFPAGVAATTLITNSTTTITGGDILNNAFSVQIVAPFVRIVYTNGAVGQSEFRAYVEARILRGL